MRTEIKPVEEVAFRPASAEELAEALRRRGEKVRLARGLYWRRLSPLMFDGLHWLSRAPAARLGKPTPWCLGWRHALPREESDLANGWLPVHVLGGDRLAAYDEHSLPGKRRNQLRKGRRLVTCVALVDPEPFLVDLLRVASSAITRIGYSSPPQKDRFFAGILRRVRQDNNLLLAGLVEDTLAGYALVSAVEDVAYIDQVMIDTAFLSSDIGTLLSFEVAQIARRSSHLRFVVYGLHSAENPQLSSFKEGMGYHVERWPVRGWMAAPLRLYLSRFAPEKLYRFLGTWDSMKSSGGSTLSAGIGSKEP